MQTCIWPCWCHYHSLSLASVKSRLFLPFWYRLTWVVLDKGLLNGCLSVRFLVLESFSLKNKKNINQTIINVTPLPLILLLHPFNGLFSRTTWVSRYQKGKTSLDLNEARDDGVLGRSGISWTIRKQSAPCSRQITTPTRQHSLFTGRMLFRTPKKQCQSIEGTKLTLANNQ